MMLCIAMVRSERAALRATGRTGRGRSNLGVGCTPARPLAPVAHAAPHRSLYVGVCRCSPVTHAATHCAFSRHAGQPLLGSATCLRNIFAVFMALNGLACFLLLHFHARAVSHLTAPAPVPPNVAAASAVLASAPADDEV